MLRRGNVGSALFIAVAFQFAAASYASPEEIAPRRTEELTQT